MLRDRLRNIFMGQVQRTNYKEIIGYDPKDCVNGASAIFFGEKANNNKPPKWVHEIEEILTRVKSY